MLLLRLLSLFLGGLTCAAVFVLARLALGIPLLGALGGRATAGIPALPPLAGRGTLFAAVFLGGVATGWMAPDRPVLHAVVLGLGVGGLGVIRRVGGPPGGPETWVLALLPLAVVAGGWLGARGRAGGEDPGGGSAGDGRGPAP